MPRPLYTALVCAEMLCLLLASPAQQLQPAPSDAPRLVAGPTLAITSDKSVAPKIRPPRPPQDQGFRRAAALTADIREDKPSLAALQDAILSARLGEAWIKVDSENARHWLRAAVRAMELQSQNSEPQTAPQRAEAVRILLKIIMPLDRNLGERLLKLQTTNPAPATPTGQSASVQSDDRWQHTRQFLDAAQSVVSQDPKLAASLARNIISLRGSKGVEILFDSGKLYGATLAGNLFSELRSSDPATADRLFMDAVTNARTDYDYSLIFALSEIAFPTVGAPDQQPLPAPLQSAVADLLASAMLRPSTGAGDMATICRLSSIATRLSPFFDPSNATGVQSALAACQGSSPTGDANELHDALLNLKTSDDFLGSGPGRNLSEEAGALQDHGGHQGPPRRSGPGPQPGDLGQFHRRRAGRSAHLGAGQRGSGRESHPAVLQGSRCPRHRPRDRAHTARGEA